MLSNVESKCVLMGLNADKFIGMKWREESRKYGFLYLRALIFFGLGNKVCSEHFQCSEGQGDEESTKSDVIALASPHLRFQR